VVGLLVTAVKPGVMYDYERVIEDFSLVYASGLFVRRRTLCDFGCGFRFPSSFCCSEFWRLCDLCMYVVEHVCTLCVRQSGYDVVGWLYGFVPMNKLVITRAIPGPHVRRKILGRAGSGPRPAAQRKATSH